MSSTDGNLNINKAYESLCTEYAKEKIKNEIKLLFECVDLEDWEEAESITHSLMFLFINNYSIRILKEANENGIFENLHNKDDEVNKGYG